MLNALRRTYNQKYSVRVIQQSNSGKEIREKVDADDVEALQIGCRPNWGELEKLRKLLEPR